MLLKTAIIEIRKQLGIPVEGFPSEEVALAWYKKHYDTAKGRHFINYFGFHYDRLTGYVTFQSETKPHSFRIYKARPLDSSVALDKAAIQLVKEEKIPDWAAPCIRLVILVGELPEDIKIVLPEHLVSPLGQLRVLVHPPKSVSLRGWKKTGELMGLLPGKVDYWKIPGISTTYRPKRQNKKELLYLQALAAYLEAVDERRENEIKGTRGLNEETAVILKNKYGWQREPDSYTVTRYLARAKKIWQISIGSKLRDLK